MSQNECELSESSEQHTCEAQKWTSTYIICPVNSHKDATTPSHYDDNTHILNTIVIFVSSVRSYTLPAPFHSLEWTTSPYIIQGDHWKRRGGRVLFMIWLWLFMTGTSICALNNYRMILKASEGTIFPQSSNFNIKKGPTKQATVKRLQQDLCTPSNMNDCIKSNSKSQLSAMTASFALKHQSKSGVFSLLKDARTDTAFLAHNCRFYLSFTKCIVIWVPYSEVWKCSAYA